VNLKNLLKFAPGICAFVFLAHAEHLQKFANARSMC
jgi:hypothetical protein